MCDVILRITTFAGTLLIIVKIKMFICTSIAHTDFLDIPVTPQMHVRCILMASASAGPFIGLNRNEAVFSITIFI